MAGQIYDTYIAALQHDLVTIPEDSVKLGVVRRPTPWFYAEIDENIPALAPPEALLTAFKSRYETLQDQGLADAEAHNTALAEIDYEDRYRQYIEESDDAQREIEMIRDRVSRGENVVLVCYENTEYKRCHRTLLKQLI